MRWATVLVGLGIGVVGAFAIQPDVVGLFHDDGLYVSVAQSMVEGNGNRLASLPGTPAQTKYPPLYSALVAVALRVGGGFPNAIWLIKGISVVSLVLVGFAGATWYAREVGPGEPWQVVFAFLLCLGPTVLPWADYALTDLPFLALVLAIVCAGEGLAFRSTSNTPRPVSRRSIVLLAVLIGAAFLMRQAAAPLVLAVAIPLAYRRRFPELALFVGLVAAIALPWLVFKWMNVPPSDNPLLAYYTRYEPSVPALWLGGDPSAPSIILGNARYIMETLDRSLSLPAAPGLRPFVYLLIVWGLARHLKQRLGIYVWFALGYLTLVLLWPFHPARYLLPIVPLMPLGLILGTRELLRWGDRAGDARIRFLGRGLAIVPIVAVLLVTSGWVVSYLRNHPAEVRQEWAGYDETFDWVRANTSPSDILATPFDPMYYLYTGRRAVRPWFHRPWTYFYPVGKAIPDIGDPRLAQKAMAGLGVRYLIFDPLKGFGERASVGAFYERVLALYSGPEYAGLPTLRFTSTDSLHRVYELPAPAGSVPPESPRRDAEAPPSQSGSASPGDVRVAPVTRGG